MRKNNKGLSLVELIVTFAIISIIGLAVYGFMSVSNRQFKSVSNDVGLQYDQQIVVNQIRDYILESSDAIYYDTDTKALYVFKQTDEKVEPDPLDPGDTGIQYKYSVSKLRFDNPNGELTPDDDSFDSTLAGTIFVKNTKLDTFDETMEAGPAYKDALDTTDGEKILGSNVQYISYDLSEAVSHKKVSFDITFYSNGKTFKSHQVVSLRNTIVDSKKLGDIYLDMSSPVTSAIESVSILRNGVDISNGVVLEDESLREIGKYGDETVSVQLSSNIQVKAASTYNYSEEVKWEITGNPAPDQIEISSNGLIKVKKDAPACTITVNAVSKDDVSKTRTADLTIVDNGKYPNKAVLTEKHEAKNGYMEYLFTPTVEYINSFNVKSELTGSELISGTMKIDWHIEGDELPGEKYGLTSGIDDNTGKLYLTDDAIDKTYKVWFTVKELKFDGEECKSNVITINLKEGDIEPYKSPESIRLSMPDVANRNDNVVATVSWINMPDSEVTYYWKVVPDADNTTGSWYDVKIGALQTNFDDIVTVDEYTVSDSNYFRKVSALNDLGSFGSGLDGTGWYESSNGNRFASINIADYLYWNRAYKFKVYAFAVGENEAGEKIIYDASGKHYVTDNLPIVPVSADSTSPKVQFILEPTEIYKGTAGYSTNKLIKINGDLPGEERAFNYRVLGYTLENGTLGSENSLLSSRRDMKTHYIFYNSSGKKVNVNKNTGSNRFVAWGDSRVDEEELAGEFAQFKFRVDIRKQREDPKDSTKLINTDFYVYNPQTMEFSITFSEETNVSGQILKNEVDSTVIKYNLSYK